MSQIELRSNRNIGPHSAPFQHSSTLRILSEKRWILRGLTLFFGVIASCGITQVAHAQTSERPSWELNLQAQGVTPTSQFTGSARFFAPARHRRHPHHNQGYVYQGYAPAPSPPPQYPQVQDGYVLQEKANRALVWSGALLFGIPYAGGLTYSVLADFPGRTEFLAIPVVGPWLVRTNESDRAARIVLGLNGLTQATGAVLLTLGLTLTRKEWVPYHASNVWVVPTATAQGQVGLVAGGKF